MCTAINDISSRHLFGRTLDLDRSYGQQIVISPRRLSLSFIHEGKNSDHYAVIGAAHLEDNYPLYFDAMNEKGLCAAALRFPELACYHKKSSEKHNVASFELIPWILFNFADAEEAKTALQSAIITSDGFSEALPPTPLHWIIGDGKRSFVIESCADRLNIYDDPFGVLTNAPDFPSQLQALGDQKSSADGNILHLPGDMSSPSRFIRAACALSLTETADGEGEAISRFFHIMGTVNQPLGFESARSLGISSSAPMKTLYTSCMDSESLTYYFTTYSCRKIRGVRLKNAHLDMDSPTSFDMEREEWFHFLN
jgi:choloylglycine hydrolase